MAGGCGLSWFVVCGQQWRQSAIEVILKKRCGGEGVKPPAPCGAGYPLAGAFSGCQMLLRRETAEPLVNEDHRQGADCPEAPSPCDGLLGRRTARAVHIQGNADQYARTTLPPRRLGNHLDGMLLGSHIDYLQRGGQRPRIIAHGQTDAPAARIYGKGFQLPAPLRCPLQTGIR